MTRSSTFTFAGLTAALALGALPATAQDQVPAAPPSPAVAPAPAAVPAAPPAEAAPATTPAEPAEAAPAPEVAAAPAEPPPVLPTTGDGAVVVNLLTKICQPLVKGGNLDALARAAGVAKDRRTEKYTVALSQRPFQIVVEPQTPANKDICEMTIRYAPGWDQPIIDAMNIWRFLHEPQLFRQRNDIGMYTDLRRTTTTWDNRENIARDGARIGLIFVQLDKLDGSSVNPGYDEALIKYQIAPTAP